MPYWKKEINPRHRLLRIKEIEKEGKRRKRRRKEEEKEDEEEEEGREEEAEEEEWRKESLERKTKK